MSQSQLNRRVRSLEPDLEALQHDLADTLVEPQAVYRVLDTTLIPAIHRVRARCKGLFAGQATFGRSVSKTEWVYGFKVGVVVSPKGVVTNFVLAPAASDDRPIGDVLIARDHYTGYLADKWPSSLAWERRWLKTYGALVVTPKRTSCRARPEKACKWAAGKRRIVEVVIWQLKDHFGLEQYRAKTLGGLLTRLAAKIAAFTFGQWLNLQRGRPLRHLADLLSKRPRQ